MPADTGVVLIGAAAVGVVGATVFFSTTGSDFTGAGDGVETLVTEEVVSEIGVTGLVEVDGAGIGMAASFFSSSSSPVRSVILIESMENLLFVCKAAAIGGSGLLGPAEGSGVVV